MTDPSQPPRFPSWLAPAVIVMLGMQLTLSWLQGGLLHRQHEDLLALREDVQILTDTLEQGLWDEGYAEEGMAPARHRPVRRSRLLRASAIQDATPEEELAQKDLENTRASAKKAVSDAREVRSKLSIEENIRKAEEKAKVESAESTWMRWLWAALGVGLVAMVVRAWLRRRG